MRKISILDFQKSDYEKYDPVPYDGCSDSRLVPAAFSSGVSHCGARETAAIAHRA
jgi:hypothetical protein